MLEEIKNLIYPPKCGICGKLNQNYLCARCANQLEKEAIWEIRSNKNPSTFFDEEMAVFPYSPMIRKYILEYKFQEKAYLCDVFVNFIIKNQKLFKKIQSYDIIIPVPISKKRDKERGYNQSLLIANKLAKKTKLNLVTNCIYKIKHTTAQSKLNHDEREKNVQNVYAIKNQQILKNKKILLLDDIYTTGNTVNACSKVLLEGEPKTVGVFVLAKVI